ncbi:MAG: hypothetical protein AAB664_00225, partial [Patescibacteria group bacterium]
MKWKTALTVALGVYGFNHILNFFDLYGSHPNIDIPMHLLGGFSIGLLGISLYHIAVKKQKLPRWFYVLFVIGFVLLVGVLWEFHEWVLDHTIHTWKQTAFSQPSAN